MLTSSFDSFGCCCTKFRKPAKRLQTNCWNWTVNSTENESLHFFRKMHECGVMGLTRRSHRNDQGTNNNQPQGKKTFNSNRNHGQQHGHGPQKSWRALLGSCLKSFEGSENNWNWGEWSNSSKHRSSLLKDTVPVDITIAGWLSLVSHRGDMSEILQSTICSIRCF